MFYKIGEVLFESDECFTTCERCSLKVMNVLYLGHTLWLRKCKRKSGRSRSKIKHSPRKQKRRAEHTSVELRK